MNRKIIMVCVATVAALLTVVSIGTTTFAHYKAETKELTNEFAPGKIETHIEEPVEGDGAAKNPKIVNDSDTPCIVRAKVLITPAEVVDIIELKKNTEDWCWDVWMNPETKETEGYVYYKKVLRGETDAATEAMFDGVSLPKNLTEEQKKILNSIETFDIAVYEESAQPTVYDGKDMISVEYGDDYMIKNFSVETLEEIFDVYEASRE